MHNIDMHLSRLRKIHIVYDGCLRPGDGRVRGREDPKQ